MLPLDPIRLAPRCTAGPRSRCILYEAWMQRAILAIITGPRQKKTFPLAAHKANARGERDSSSILGTRQWICRLHEKTSSRLAAARAEAGVTSRRERIEWPLHIPTRSRRWDLTTGPIDLDPVTVANLRDFLADEYAEAGTVAAAFLNVEICFHTLSGMLTDLYIRARQQSAVWDIWLQLCHQGLLDVEDLKTRIPLEEGVPADLQPVVALLACLEFPAKLIPTRKRVGGRSQFDKLQRGTLYQLYVPALVWLATLMVRSRVDVTILFEAILRTDYLGCRFSVERLDQLFHETAQESGTSVSGSWDDLYGYWLPDEITGRTCVDIARDLRRHVQRFNEIEEWYKMWFGLADEDLLLESKQTTVGTVKVRC